MGGVGGPSSKIAVTLRTMDVNHGGQGARPPEFWLGDADTIIDVRN